MIVPSRACDNLKFLDGHVFPYNKVHKKFSLINIGKYIQGGLLF
jgi:hypothetical protein